MSLKEDQETYDRHKRNGTLKDYLAGTAAPINLRDEPWPVDPKSKDDQGL